MSYYENTKADALCTRREEAKLNSEYSDKVIKTKYLVLTVLLTFFASYYGTLELFWISPLLILVLLLTQLNIFINTIHLSVFIILVSIPAGAIAIPILDKTPSIYFPSILSVFLLIHSIFNHKKSHSQLIDDSWAKEKSIIIYLTVLYCISLLISMCQANEPARTLYLGIVRLIILLAYISILKFDYNQKQRICILKIISFIGVVITVYYIVNAALVYGTSYENLSMGLAAKDNLARAGFLGTTNTIASFLVFTIPLSLSFWYHVGKASIKLKLLMIFGIFAQLILLSSISSRAGIVGLIGGLLLGFSLSGRLLTRNAKLGRFIFTILIFLSIAFILTPDPVIVRTKNVFSQERLENEFTTDYGRLALIRSAFDAFKQNPIIGIGIGNFANFNLNYSMGSGSETHNIFFQTLAEEGIVGFILLVSILFLLIKRLIYLCKISNSISQILILSSTLGTLLNSSFEPTFWHVPFATLFWLSLAVLTTGTISTPNIRSH
jgi:O-antigen ligase